MKMDVGVEGQEEDNPQNSAATSSASTSTKAGRRHRKKAHEVDRKFECPYPGCSKAYGNSSSLHLHIKTKHADEEGIGVNGGVQCISPVARRVGGGAGNTSSSAAAIRGEGGFTMTGHGASAAEEARPPVKSSSALFHGCKLQRKRSVRQVVGATVAGESRSPFARFCNGERRKQEAESFRGETRDWGSNLKVFPVPPPLKEVEPADSISVSSMMLVSPIARGAKPAATMPLYTLEVPLENNDDNKSEEEMQLGNMDDFGVLGRPRNSFSNTISAMFEGDQVDFLDLAKSGAMRSRRSSIAALTSLLLSETDQHSSHSADLTNNILFSTNLDRIPSFSLQIAGLEKAGVGAASTSTTSNSSSSWRNGPGIFGGAGRI
jgi:hypothetical protein